LSLYLTQISPSLKFRMSIRPNGIPAVLAIFSANGRLALPEKIFKSLMIALPIMLRVREKDLNPGTCCWGARIRTWECPAKRGALPLGYSPIISLNRLFPFRDFRYRSRWTASDRLEQDSDQIKARGLLPFVEATRPSLCRRNLPSRSSVCPM
jgi:hypothetical protein